MRRAPLNRQADQTPFHIAYLILAHRDPAQVVRLVRRLDGPNRTFVLHLDAKCEGHEWDDALRQLEASNLRRADRVTCSWGEFSVVEATLNAIRALLASGAPFDQAVLLSGQDYPIKSNVYIEQALRSKREQCLMYLFPFPFREWPWQGYHRLPAWRVPLFGRKRRLVPVHLSRFAHRRIPGGLHPYGGSQWWALPKQALLYIREFVAAHPAFVEYFRNVLIPDELFIHTILGNSPLHIEPGRHNPHYIRWTEGAHPDVMAERDIPALCESEKLFARKFDWAAGLRVLDWIDQECAAHEWATSNY